MNCNQYYFYSFKCIGSDKMVANENCEKSLRLVKIVLKFS